MVLTEENDWSSKKLLHISNSNSENNLVVPQHFSHNVLWRDEKKLEYLAEMHSTKFGGGEKPSKNH